MVSSKLEFVEQFQRTPVAPEYFLWLNGCGSANLALPILGVMVIGLGNLMFVVNSKNVLKLHYYIMRLGPYAFVPIALGLGFRELLRPLMLVGARDHQWIAVLSCVVALAYCVTRYAIVNRLEMYPILYLRSFSDPESAKVYAHIIAPTAGLYAPLVGMVHATQSLSSIFSQAHPAFQARLLACDESTWRNWIESKMLSAMIVVFDLTSATSGVLWELELARRIVTPDKIVIIGPGGIGADPQERTKAAGRRNIRRQLKHWFESRFFENQQATGLLVFIFSLLLIITAVSTVSLGLPNHLFDKQESAIEKVNGYVLGNEPDMAWGRRYCPALGLLEYEN